jgi:hypothetical protein
MIIGFTASSRSTWLRPNGRAGDSLCGQPCYLAGGMGELTLRLGVLRWRLFSNFSTRQVPESGVNRRVQIVNEGH